MPNTRGELLAVKIMFNLKQVMRGPNLVIPRIFLLDSRLNADDREFIGNILSFADPATGDCAPRIKDLARQCGYNPRTVFRRKKRLIQFGYLKNEKLNGDRRRGQYLLTIPVSEIGWQRALEWQRFFGSFRRFRNYLLTLFKNAVNPDSNSLLLINKYIKVINTSKVKESRWRSVSGLTPIVKPKKPKRKRGRSADTCLSDPESPYYEDDRQKTQACISAYGAWLRKYTGGKDDPVFHETNSYYKYFVKIRKQLVAFRGKRRSPSLFKLFYDYFKITYQIHDNRSWTPPYISQLANAKLFSEYKHYIAQGFPMGGYWIPTEFPVNNAA